MLKKITEYFVISRLVFLLPLVAGALLIPYRDGYEFTNIYSLNNLTVLQAAYSLANFDGVRYLAIALRGYISEAAFFPLFPFFIKLFSFWSSNQTILFWVGFLISNIFFLFALIFFYKLIRLDYKKQIAEKSVLFLLLFPTAFFFGAIYSESLFFLLLTLSFYFARKKKWFLASFFGMLLSVTRLVGIFILPALLYELWLQKKTIREYFSRVWELLIIPLGLIAYSYFNLIKWGDVLYFIHAHGQLANSRSVDRIIFFPQTIFRYLKILLSLPFSQYEWWIAFLEISVFIFVSFLLYLGFKQRIRFSYLLFSILAFLLPVSSGTFSGLPRYVIILSPIYIALALNKNNSLKILYFLICPIILFILLMFFSRGYFVA